LWHRFCHWITGKNAAISDGLEISSPFISAGSWHISNLEEASFTRWQIWLAEMEVVSFQSVMSFDGATFFAAFEVSPKINLYNNKY